MKLRYTREISRFRARIQPGIERVWVGRQQKTIPASSRFYRSARTTEAEPGDVKYDFHNALAKVFDLQNRGLTREKKVKITQKFLLSGALLLTGVSLFLFTYFNFLNNGPVWLGGGSIMLGFTLLYYGVKHTLSAFSFRKKMLIEVKKMFFQEIVSLMLNSSFYELLLWNDPLYSLSRSILIFSKRNLSQRKAIKQLDVELSFFKKYLGLFISGNLYARWASSLAKKEEAGYDPAFEGHVFFASLFYSAEKELLGQIQSLLNDESLKDDIKLWRIFRLINDWSRKKSLMVIQLEEMCEKILAAQI